MSQILNATKISQISDCENWLWQTFASDLHIIAFDFGHFEAFKLISVNINSDSLIFGIMDDA